MLVETGKIYRATLRLNWMGSHASNTVVQKRFEDVGFVDVTVIGSGYDRTAIGRWPLANAEADLPSQVTKVEVQN